MEQSKAKIKNVGKRMEALHVSLISAFLEKTTKYEELDGFSPSYLFLSWLREFLRKNLDAAKDVLFLFYFIYLF